MADEWDAFKPQQAEGAPAGAPAAAPAANSAPAPGGADPWSAFEPKVDYSQLGAIPQSFKDRLGWGQGVSDKMADKSYAAKAGDTLSALWSAAKEGNAAGYDAEGLARQWSKSREDLAKFTGPNGDRLGGWNALQSTVEGMESYMHTINGIIMGAGAATGQAVSMAKGEGEVDQAKARRDFAQMFMMGAVVAGSDVSGMGEAPAMVTRNGEFARLENINGKVEAQVVGTMPTPKDFADVAQQTGAHEQKLYDLWKEKGVHPNEAHAMMQKDAFVAHDLSSAAAVVEDLPPLISPDIQPLSVPGRIQAAFTAAKDKAFDFAGDVQMQISPMAAGDNITAKATAKDFANTMRRNAWDAERWMSKIDNEFSKEERTKMWTAIDEENQWRHAGEEPPQGVGLGGLDARMRNEVDQIIAHNEADKLAMIDRGMLKPDAGMDVYAARIATGIKYDGMKGSRSINSLGLNLKTTTARLKERKYLTVEETEAALQKIHPEATISRDIKSNILAMKQSRDAMAGRDMVDAVKDYSNKVGADQISEGAIPAGAKADEWFPIDHPALKTWRPRMEKLVDGGWQAMKDANGGTIFEQVQLYMHKDWEGPMRAVLTTKPNKVVNAMMEAKGKAMSLIMYSPMVHNSVIASKALAGFKGNIYKLAKTYWEGNRVKNDPAQMVEAIDAGMVPIGKRYFKQDLTDQLEMPDLTPGRSLTAKMAAAIPDLFDPAAGVAVKKAIDKAGDFWHNTLLWDRVADLQAGTYAHFRDEFTQSGIDRQTASRMAAHEANRLAGTLPAESMSRGARTIANMAFFSRTFTLGNLGIMKDMLTGLPKDVLAQIERDAGPGAMMDAKSMARRTAFATVATDMALFYVGTSVMQSAMNVILGGASLSDEAYSYWTRLQKEIEAKASSPWSMVPPWGIYSFLNNVSSTAGNEPGKGDRALIGYMKDGTGIYAKSPLGRIGEEFSSYTQGFWIDMMNRKMSTMARPAWQIMSNDKGFGRKIYDPHIDNVGAAASAAWQIAKHFAESQTPVTQLEAAARLVKGEGDQKLNTLQTVGPFLPPPFTFTASKGAPGGPAVGMAYDVKNQFETRVRQAMPGVRQMIQSGDFESARKAMDNLKMDQRYQNYVFKTEANPSLRLSTRTMRDFYNHASPDQIERFQNLRR
jgi:hypothetical protein